MVPIREERQTVTEEKVSCRFPTVRSRHLGKAAQEMYSKCIGEDPCRSVISIKLQSNFIEITL